MNNLVSFYEFEIDTICRDLQIPRERIHIEFIPERKTINGDCTYNPYTRYNIIRICRDMSYRDTIEILMHELKHAEQYLLKKLQDYGCDCIWLNTHHKRMSITDSDYSTQPWEIDADEYMLEFDRLFLPKQFVGSIGGVKLYKLESNPRK